MSSVFRNDRSFTRLFIVALAGGVLFSGAEHLGGAAFAKSSNDASTPPTPHLVAVHIVSKLTNSDNIPTTRPKRTRADIGVTMFAVVETRIQRKRVFFSEAGKVRIGSRTYKTRPMSEGPVVQVSWYKVEPTIETMSNTASGNFRYERIEYSEVLVRPWMLQYQVEADVHPMLTPDHGNGVGTMRFKVIAKHRDITVSSPGVEAQRKGASGGLTDAVHRVSLRRDDSFLGVMTEMYGQPYIWASAGRSPRKHQSERLEGSDCADLMVYGARRKGYDIPYTWTGGMHEYTRVVAKGMPREDGVYVDKNGEPIPFPRVGDMLLFDRHIGALTEDRGVPGVLDTSDIMMHTNFHAPREDTVESTFYRDAAIKVIRWKRKLDHKRVR